MLYWRVIGFDNDLFAHLLPLSPLLLFWLGLLCLGDIYVGFLLLFLLFPHKCIPLKHKFVSTICVNLAENLLIGF